MARTSSPRPLPGAPILPFLAAGAVFLAAGALSGCPGRDAPAPFPDPPPAAWSPAAQAHPASLLGRLEAARLTGGPDLGGAVHGVFAEGGRILVVLREGRVRALQAGPEGAVTLAGLGSLPPTCLPHDLAADGAGRACALVPCRHRALCYSGEAWTERALLREDGVEGLSSAPGAVLAWRAVGGGTLRRDTAGTVRADPGPPARELLVTTDGGASFGLLGRVDEAALLGVEAAGPGEVHCVSAPLGDGLLRTRVDCLGGGGGVRFTAFGPVQAAFSRAVVADGAVFAARLHGGRVQVEAALPHAALGVVHEVPVSGPVALAPWGAGEVVIADGLDLHVLDLAAGRFRTRAGLLPKAARDLAGLGRVGERLVLVGVNGATWEIELPGEAGVDAPAEAPGDTDAPAPTQAPGDADAPAPADHAVPQDQ